MTRHRHLAKCVIAASRWRLGGDVARRDTIPMDPPAASPRSAAERVDRAGPASQLDADESPTLETLHLTAAEDATRERAWLADDDDTPTDEYLLLTRDPRRAERDTTPAPPPASEPPSTDTRSRTSHLIEWWMDEALASHPPQAFSSHPPRES